jgi:predicted RNase H-like HicB family nuclease
MNKLLKVTAAWDDEAKVWVAESDDVPGLITEADTIPALVEKLKAMVPEMLELNGVIQPLPDQIPFELLASCTVTAHAH